MKLLIDIMKKMSKMKPLQRTTTFETLKIGKEILSRLDFPQRKVRRCSSLFAKQSRLKNKHWVKMKLKALSNKLSFLISFFFLMHPIICFFKTFAFLIFIVAKVGSISKVRNGLKSIESTFLFNNGTFHHFM